MEDFWAALEALDLGSGFGGGGLREECPACLTTLTCIVGRSVARFVVIKGEGG